MPTPLEGIRVLDFSRVLAGPYCTMMMGDMGAEIIKVEDPGKGPSKGGDDTRYWGPPFLGTESTYFLAVNRGKKSITLNLKSPGGLETARRLAACSDVLVENFRPGAMERLGLGYEAIAAINPKLVYCSISGFGQTGPERERPGYDAVVQGESGIMSVTGFPDGPPTKVGISIADLVAGLLAFQGILLALRVAERTGKGQWVDIALLDGQVSLLTFQAASYFATGKNPTRKGNIHPMITPYETYQTSDGYVIIAVGNDGMWRRFRALVGLPDAEEFSSSAKRVDRREELAAILIPIIAQRTTAEWLADLRAAGIPCGQVRNIGEVLADPQVLFRGMVEEVDHASLGRIQTTGIPVKLSETPGRVTTAPPLLGAHTDQVLSQTLSMTAEEIEKLRAAGAL
jgi:formyl-CoA transferase/CoA:oxalate CoA-transferase